MTITSEEVRDIPDDILEHLIPTQSAAGAVKPLHDELLNQVVRDDHEQTVLLIFVASHHGQVTHTRVVKLRWWMPEMGDYGWRLCESTIYTTGVEVATPRGVAGGTPKVTTLVY